MHYGERWDGGPHIETGVTHSRLRLPSSSPWLRRSESANRGVPDARDGDLAGLDAPDYTQRKEFIVGGQVSGT